MSILVSFVEREDNIGNTSSVLLNGSALSKNCKFLKQTGLNRSMQSWERDNKLNLDEEVSLTIFRQWSKFREESLLQSSLNTSLVKAEKDIGRVLPSFGLTSNLVLPRVEIQKPQREERLLRNLNQILVAFFTSENFYEEQSSMSPIEFAIFRSVLTRKFDKTIEPKYIY
jgi:hypothetical protein